MFIKTASTIAFILISLIFLKWGSRKREQRRRSALAKQLGCGSCQKTVRELPFGVDHVLRNYRSDQDKRYPPMLVDRQTKYALHHTIEISVFLHTNYYTIDPLNIQTILATKFNDFVIGPRRSGNFFPLLGDGIFTQDGEAWKHSRTMLRPHFARTQIDEGDWLGKHVQRLMGGLMLDSDTRTTAANLQPLFFKLTFDASLEFLFGDIKSTKAGSDEKEKFAKAFDLAQSYLATRLRIDELYWLYGPPEFQVACKEVKAFIEHLVQEALAARETIGRTDPVDATSTTQRYTFLQALMEDTQSVPELRDQLMHILLAGRDTTASLLSWLIFCLSHHQDTYSSLRMAILQTFGTYTKPRNLTFPHIKSCQQLMYTINETLRLFPPVPINIRYAVRDTTLRRGGGEDESLPILIPSGAEVAYSVHAMHRCKDIWGPDAEKFRPGRWENLKTGWDFLPFNGGPRICLGQQFAIMEVSYVVIRLIQRFESMDAVNDADGGIRGSNSFKSGTVNGIDGARYALGLTSRPADGVFCLLKEARDI